MVRSIRKGVHGVVGKWFVVVTGGEGHCARARGKADATVDFPLLAGFSLTVVDC